MNLRKLIFTNNDCYKAGRKIAPQGIMVHSTGANNPNLKRYVGPNDGLLGENRYNNHWNQPMDRKVCVHAFIGKLADGTIATYQTLPWNHRGWHCSSGSKGSGNDTHISFESVRIICRMLPTLIRCTTKRWIFAPTSAISMG